MSEPGDLQDQHARSAAVTRAVLGAARLLEITSAELKELLDIDEAKSHALHSGDAVLQETETDSWGRAILFIRMYRSLVTIVSDDRTAIAWLRGPNLALGDTPIGLIGTRAGLESVVGYLEAQL